MAKSVPLPWTHVRVKDDFWSSKQDVVREVVIPYQYDALHDRIPGVAPSHAVENFRVAAGLSQGEHKGMAWQDTDVAKWIEAAAYSLATHPDEALEKRVDDLIELVAQAQQGDGYLNTYFTLAAPDKRWTNLRVQHELYTAGHMIEAAVAYFEATGKRRLLDVACRLADHIDERFGTGPGQMRGYPGHPEIELALARLFRATGEARYLKLSKFFVDERGAKPHWYAVEAGDDEALTDPEVWRRRDYSYSQAHAPVREQDSAEGHSVRAVYLYAAMADLALETGDATLLKACERLWRSVTERRMYVTGAIGSQAHGERFTIDYDLPNARAYAETCASVGLIFWAQRMLSLDVDRAYADVMELALYNGALSGMSLDGKAFFYVNPLEVVPETASRRHDHHHVETVRQGWFNCACCPPNIARLIASIGSYMYSLGDETLYVHLYAGSEASFDISGTRVKLEQRTRYPWDGAVQITLRPEKEAEFALALRIPGWSRDARIQVNGDDLGAPADVRKGYAHVRRLWRAGDVVDIEFSMPVERIRAHPRARDNAGKVALQRGPIVYALEEVDNGPLLHSLALPRHSVLAPRWDPALLGGVVVVEGDAARLDEARTGSALYQRVDGDDPWRPARIRAIPYAYWCNRQPGEMLVWIRELPGDARDVGKREPAVK